MNEQGKNADIVGRAYAAFNSGDMETLTALFHEDATWHTPGRSSVAGLTQGREETFVHFGRYAGETQGTFKAMLEALFESEDGRVVGLHHNTAQRNGKQLDTGCCIVFELEDGRIISGREHFVDLYNWDDVWS